MGKLTTNTKSNNNNNKGMNEWINKRQTTSKFSGALHIIHEPK